MGESGTEALRVTFDTSVKLEFHGGKVVEHARYVVFQMAEVAVPRKWFAAILERIRELQRSEGRLVPSG